MLVFDPSGDDEPSVDGPRTRQPRMMQKRARYARWTFASAVP